MASNNNQNAILVFEATHLPSKDLLSASDPFVVVFIRNRNDRDSDFVEIGRTETIKNQPNPKWKENVPFDFCMHDMQELKMVLYDSDSSKQSLSKHDIIKEFTVPVSELLKSGQGVKTFDWLHKPNDKKSATFTVRYEKGTSNNDSIKMRVTCKDLPKMDLFGSADPYFVIERLAEDNKTYIKMYESKVIKNTKTPEWIINESVRTLCNGALKVPLRISVFDWDKNSAHDLIGTCEVSFADIVADRSTTLELVYPNKKHRGSITFDNVVLTHKKGFADLIKDGLNMNVIMAIDFTGSNGHPNDVDSLHYCHTQENQYQESIRRIGSVVVEYDSDKSIPLLGFGGQPNNESDVNHCFELVYNGPESVSGVERALDTYKQSLKTVTLSGPTLFQDVISYVIKKAKKSGSKDYYLLVIMTDGTINDMKKVKDMLVEASGLPLSVLIVGVGHADFTDMRELDSDGKKLTDSRGFTAERDIVNFIEMDKVRRKGESSLAKETLSEFPNQVESYYAKFN